MKTILSVVGARPNFMKVAPLHRALGRSGGGVRSVIVHTGQHYDERMSKVFFDDLELPMPDVYLGVGSGTHGEQTGRIMVAFEKVLGDLKPGIVVVVGDVNSTLACSVVAAKAHVPVAHVEAGLRSFDRTMPEEINRIVTDTLSDLLFVTEQSGVDNLRKEGVDKSKIHLVGNTMIDSLVHMRDKAARSRIMEDLSLQDGSFMLVTLHRPSNVDSRDALSRIVAFFEAYAPKLTVVFPVHPRTRKMLAEFGLLERLGSHANIRLTEPLGYLDFLRLMGSAKVVLTDSGGIQEETTFLGVPCLTLRDNTERPVTVDTGTNILAGSDISRAQRHVDEVLRGTKRQGSVPPLWDGNASTRIAETLLTYLGTRS